MRRSPRQSNLKEFFSSASFKLPGGQIYYVVEPRKSMADMRSVYDLMNRMLGENRNAWKASEVVLRLVLECDLEELSNWVALVKINGTGHAPSTSYDSVSTLLDYLRVSAFVDNVLNQALAETVTDEASLRGEQSYIG